MQLPASASILMQRCYISRVRMRCNLNGLYGSVTSIGYISRVYKMQHPVGQRPLFKVMLHLACAYKMQLPPLSRPLLLLWLRYTSIVCIICNTNKHNIMYLENYEVAQVAQGEAQNVIQLDAIEKANVDVQVATAKRFPRNLTRSIQNSIVMATMDVDTARTMGYALPRGGKPITGPSVHLAKLIVSNYGNIRAEAKVVQITDSQIVSRGTCWDLENNVATAIEVRRSIKGKNGQRFSDDMVTVVGNAANSIAYRNAVFSVIPKAITEKVYQAAQHCITGDLSDEAKLLQRRTQCLKFFNDEYGINEEEIVKLCGKQTVNQIRGDEMAYLLGVYQSLKDGDTTVDEVMQSIRKEEGKKRITEIAAETSAKKE